MMMCPDGYEWIGEHSDGHCEQCEAGHYSHSNGLRSRCLPCPIGEYSNVIGTHYCQKECDYLTTLNYGSKEDTDCVDLDNMFGEGSFQSEVAVEVKLTGDWTFLNPVLMEVSGINFYHARGSMEYHEDDHTSSLHVSAVLPNTIAVHFHRILLKLEVHKNTLNDYAALGDHYTRKIFDMLNNAETFKEFGWKMNHDQLKVKDVKILDVAVHLNQHCEHGYRSVEWEGVGTKCVEDNQAPTPSEKSWYIQYVGESEDCDSLGGEARLTHFVENDWPFPCLEDEECEAHFATCKTLTSGECAIMIHLIFHDNEAGKGDIEANLNKARSVKYHGDTMFKYSEDNPYESREDCGVDPKIGGDGSMSCSDECDAENGYRLTRSGNCEKCPYGTWFDRESDEVFQRCHSCSFHTPLTVFNKVPKSAAGCSNSGQEATRNSDGVWTYYSGEDIDTDFAFNMLAEVHMDLCEIMNIKNDLDSFCSDKYPMDDMSLDDFTDYNGEMLVCVVMHEFSEIYDHSCEESSKTWSDIMDDFDWEDAACFAAKGLHTIESQGGSCDDLSDDDKRLEMNFKSPQFWESIDYEYADWANAFYLPLFSHIKKMNKFHTDTVSEAVEGLLRKFGMYDMSKLTGMEMMRFVRDMIIAAPRGLAVRDTSFEFTTGAKDIFCDDQETVRKSCSSEKERVRCKQYQCNHDTHDESDLECSADPCNNCQIQWKYNSEVVTCENRALKTDCGMPDTIENGKLFKLGLEKYYVSGGEDYPYDVYTYSCDKGYRINNLGAYDDFPSVDESHSCGEEYVIIDFFCKDESTMSLDPPTCEEDTCKYEEIENGHIRETYKSTTSGCRYAVYECDIGYEMGMEGDSRMSNKVYCNPDGTYSKKPTCVAVDSCELPSEDELENSIFIGKYFVDYDWESNTKKQGGWYQCHPGTTEDRENYYEIECGDDSFPDCEREGECPTEIENGYLMWEWELEEDNSYIGEYRCYEGFELRNPKMFNNNKADYEEHYGWGACGSDGDFDPENLPRCVKPGTPEPCDMPKETLNGYRVEEIMNEEYGVIDQAKYKCNSGYMMVETWKGDIGWCRNDGTFELPYCMSPREWFTVEFELVPGFSKMENAGRVKARHVYADGSADDWYAGCNDHFNGPAAGAICRSMGFRHGKQITGDKKMKPIPDLPFGMTNIYCYHDDTLIMR